MDKSLYSCPVGKEGIEIIERMNEHHSELTDWALSYILDIDPKDILDIGCGGGMFLRKLGMMFGNSNLYGIDISDDCVRIASKINELLINDGRLSVINASVESIPFDDSKFDLITAVETYFFWPDLERNLEEVRSKLSEKGILVIVSEQYPDPAFEEKNKSVEEECGAKLVTNQRMEEILSCLDLSVKVHTCPEKNWVTFIAEVR